MPIISVIVPVYNVEKYLHCCVDSILAQTYTDIEVLLVDDGSTDCSGAICDEYAQKDSRVRVFHKENGGVSSARNLGLDEARGKWIMFVDGDDKVAPQICGLLMENALEGCLPICAHYIWEDDKVRRRSPEVERKHFLLKEFMELRSWLRTPWGRLFEREIINRENLKFDTSISYGEDTVFNYDYVKYVDEIWIVDRPLYYYRMLDNSLSRGKYIADYENIMEFIFEKRLQLAKSLSVDMSSFLDKHYSEYFFELCYAFNNNMRKDAPGSLWQKIQRNDAILRSEGFKKAYPYRYERPKDFTKRYIHMLELSYLSGNYFWLWLLDIPGKIKSFIAGKR